VQSTVVVEADTGTDERPHDAIDHAADHSIHRRAS
jgi:hypothetical protein